jgi:hypothetical protein
MSELAQAATVQFTRASSRRSKLERLHSWQRRAGSPPLCAHAAGAHDESARRHLRDLTTTEIALLRRAVAMSVQLRART